MVYKITAWLSLIGVLIASKAVVYDRYGTDVIDPIGLLIVIGLICVFALSSICAITRAGGRIANLEQQKAKDSDLQNLRAEVQELRNTIKAMEDKHGQS